MSAAAPAQTEHPQSQPAATTAQPEAANTNAEQNSPTQEIGKATHRKVAKVLKSKKKPTNSDKEQTPKHPPGHDNKKEDPSLTPPHADGKKEGERTDKKDDKKKNDESEHDESHAHTHHVKKFTHIPPITTKTVGEYFNKKKKKASGIFGSIGNALLLPFAPLRYFNTFIPWKGMKNGVVNAAKATKNGIKKTAKTIVLAPWYLAQAGFEGLTSGVKKITKFSKKEERDDLKLEPLTPAHEASHPAPAAAAPAATSTTTTPAAAVTPATTATPAAAAHH